MIRSIRAHLLASIICIKRGGAAAADGGGISQGVIVVPKCHPPPV